MSDDDRRVLAAIHDDLGEVQADLATGILDPFTQAELAQRVKLIRDSAYDHLRAVGVFGAGGN